MLLLLLLLVAVVVEEEEAPFKQKKTYCCCVVVVEVAVDIVAVLACQESSPLEMSALAEGSPAESQSLSVVARRTRSQRGSAEHRSPSQHWPSGAPHSLTTTPRDQGGAAEQVCLECVGWRRGGD